MKKVLQDRSIVRLFVIALAVITVVATLCGRLIPDYWQINFLMAADVLIGFGSCLAGYHVIRRCAIHPRDWCYLVSLPALCSAYFFFNCGALPSWRWTAGAFCFFAFGLATLVCMFSRYRREILGFSKIRKTFSAASLVVATGLALKFVVVPLSAATTPLTGSAFVLYVGY